MSPASDSIEKLVEHGKQLWLAGRAEESAAAFGAAICLQPDHGESYNDLGTVFSARSQHEKALGLLRRGVGLRPALPELHGNLGAVLADLGRLDEAQEELRVAITLCPDYADALNNRGNLLKTLGREKEARADFGRAIALDSARGRYYYNLSSIHRFTKGDPMIEAMETLSAGTGPTDPGGALALHFTLGAAYEQTGAYEQAFRHFLAGNRLKRGDISYDEPHRLKQMGRVSEIATADRLKALVGGGDPSEVPIFILGMPRSGTSLVEQILASHSLVFGAGEREELGRLTVALQREMDGEFPGLLEDITADRLERLGRDYLAALRPLAPGAKRIVDKMPGNFLLAGLIRLALPNAKIIHCRRDPIDTCLSNFTTLFTVGQDFSYDLAELGRYYRAYEEVMRHWRSVLPEESLLEVDYEAVVADLEGQARRILDFCGLDWEPACLSFHSTERPVRTASSAQVRKPLYKSSVRRGDRFAANLAPLKAALETPFPSLSDALGHHRAGRRAEASALYRTLLVFDPANDQALHLNGVIAQQEGALVPALRSIGRAIRLDALAARYHANLGASLRTAGQSGEAVTAYRRSLVIAPDGDAAFADLAAALRDAGNKEQALRAYEAALRLDPFQAETRNNYGALLSGFGRLEEANRVFTLAACLDPAHQASFSNRGYIQAEWKSSEKAERASLIALTLKPDHAEAHCNLGNAFWHDGRVGEALACYRKALALHPGHASSYGSLGAIQQERGQLQPAAASFRRGFILSPREADFYRCFVAISKVAAGDPIIGAMEALAEDKAGLDASQQAELHFALGTVYGQIGRHRESLEQFITANAFKRQTIAYNEEGALAHLSDIAGTFSPALIEAGARKGELSEIPVFIVGMPRSGTSLAEQILASHPLVFGAGERLDLWRLISAAGVDAGMSYPDFMPGLSGRKLRQLGKDYVAALRKLAPEAVRIVDKMPGNFQYAGLIHMALPKARIIHCRRDPIDTCLSCFSHMFTESQAFTYDLGELGRYYRGYEALMAHWRAVLPKGAMLELNYESVVADLEGQARRLLDFCGLPWDPACLEFHRTERSVRTASAAQVRQPIYKSSVGKRERYGDGIAPLIEALESPKREAMTQIVIDNVTYEVESLSEAARQQLVSLQFAESEIKRLQMQLALAQTARAAYAAALKDTLPSK